MTVTGDFSVREIYFDPGVTLPSHYHEHICLSLLAGVSARSKPTAATWRLCGNSPPS